MAELGAFFGNPNLQRQGARARALAAQRDVNTLADPRTYAIVQGLLGTAPDEMGFSVLNPNYEKIKKVAEPAFALGLLGQASPLLAPMTKGLPVGASVKNVGKDLFETSKKYHQKIPEVKNINVANLKRMNSGEVADVSDEVAANMDFSQPIKVSVFADGEMRIVDGHHRVAAAKKLGIESLPVELQAINAKGETLNKLVKQDNYVKYPQQEALDTAQRNAALPIEEGGLGLPKDNTPEMRAEALGNKVPAYHATTVWEADDGRKLGDIEAFNRLASTEIVGRKPSIDQVGIWASDRADELGAGMYSGSQGAIYPLLLRMENPKTTSFEQMSRTASNLSSGEPLAAGVVPRVSDVEPYRQMLKEQGFDSLIIKAKEGSPFTEFKDQTGYVVLDPSQIRSRFAAFDPKRRNEPDILAGVLPLGLLADEEQRKKLYELMPSLLGE
jgi:hypothetical protein